MNRDGFYYLFIKKYSSRSINKPAEHTIGNCFWFGKSQNMDVVEERTD